jgi:hypothetical protein
MGDPVNGGQHGWRTATYSNGNAECVEVGHTIASIAVRDTTDRPGTVLTIPSAAWRRFTCLAAMRNPGWRPPI